MPLLKEQVCNYIYSISYNSHSSIDTLFPSFFNRKHKIRRSIKVPATSPRLANIPGDEYSWRKYGQKPVKGSPHPRYIRHSIL